MINLLDSDARGAQAILDGLGRKTRAVLDAIEALFFDGRDKPAVAHDRRRCITVISVYAEDVHQMCSQGVTRREHERMRRFKTSLVLL